MKNMTTKKTTPGQFKTAYWKAETRADLTKIVDKLTPEQMEEIIKGVETISNFFGISGRETLTSVMCQARLDSIGDSK